MRFALPSFDYVSALGFMQGFFLTTGIILFFLTGNLYILIHTEIGIILSIFIGLLFGYIEKRKAIREQGVGRRLNK